jgi:hypothetical protein
MSFRRTRIQARALSLERPVVIDGSTAELPRAGRELSPTQVRISHDRSSANPVAPWKDPPRKPRFCCPPRAAQLRPRPRAITFEAPQWERPVNDDVPPRFPRPGIEAKLQSGHGVALGHRCSPSPRRSSSSPTPNATVYGYAPIPGELLDGLNREHDLDLLR